MVRRPEGATDLDTLDVSEDGRRQWTDVKNARETVPPPERRTFAGSVHTPNTADHMQPVGRNSETPVQPTFRNTASSEALFMSPTSRMLYDRSVLDESGQAEGLFESYAYIIDMHRATLTLQLCIVRYHLIFFVL